MKQQPDRSIKERDERSEEDSEVQINPSWSDPVDLAQAKVNVALNLNLISVTGNIGPVVCLPLHLGGTNILRVKVSLHLTHLGLKYRFHITKGAFL